MFFLVSELVNWNFTTNASPCNFQAAKANAQQAKSAAQAVKDRALKVDGDVRTQSSKIRKLIDDIRRFLQGNWWYDSGNRHSNVFYTDPMVDTSKIRQTVRRNVYKKLSCWLRHCLKRPSCSTRFASNHPYVFPITIEPIQNVQILKLFVIFPCWNSRAPVIAVLDSCCTLD